MYRVLVVDDHDIIRKGLIKMLSKLEDSSCEYYEADCGLEAKKIALAIKPDIVFTDIMMPDINGLDFINSVKEQLPSCRFVIISGYNDFSYAKTAIKLGVCEYLLKPFDRKEVETVFNSLLKDVDQQKKKTGSNMISCETIQNIDNIGYMQNRIIEFAVDYINENYSKDINLASVANMVSKNYNYFSTLFKNETGKTFSEYLREVRVEKAKELLKDLNNKVVDVYKKVGFSDYNYFCKTFTRMVGITPMQYKRNIK